MQIALKPGSKEKQIIAIRNSKINLGNFSRPLRLKQDIVGEVFPLVGKHPFRHQRTAKKALISLMLKTEIL
mgnify:CR=1 FL=1